MHRKQTVNGEPLTPTWLPLTSTVSAFGLLHFSLRTMAGENTIPLNLDCISGRFLWHVALLFLSGIHRKIGLKIKMYVLTQTAVPLYVIPWCISRGKQCFWRPVWRPLCTLLLLYMSTTVLLHWSLTPSPCQVTSLSLSMGKSVLLSKKQTNSISFLLNFQHLFD